MLVFEERVASGKVGDTLVDESIAAELGVVAAHEGRVFAGRGQNAVAVERLAGVEVEDKEQVVAHEGEHLVSVVLAQFDDGSLFEFFLLTHQMNHRLVEGTEVLVFQVVAVHEVPLAAGILVGPAVTLAGKVDPFGVTELVAHEVEVAAVDGREGDEPYHLVQSHAAVYDKVGIVLAHVPVHHVVDEAEDDGLVAHQCLVVTLGIVDGLLVGPPVGQFPEDGRRFPVLVLLLLDGLDPEVGDTHGHAVVKADAPVLELGRQTWHAAHLFGDGDGVGIDLVDKLVGQGEVDDGVVVLPAVVVVVVGAEGLSQPVVVVEHRGDAVEPESIEVKFVEPVLAVGEQEVNHGVLAIVETERVPGWVFPSVVAIEILVVGSVESSQPLHLVFDGV